MALKIILGSIFSVAVLLGVMLVEPYLNDNYQVVKNYKVFKDLNVVFVEDDVTNLYILNDYDLKHIKNSISKQKNLILRTKRIYVSDINVTFKNYLTIRIKENKYLSGKILHFQNYLYENDKELKVLLKIF